MNLEELVLKAWDDRDLLKDEIYSDAIRNTIDKLDEGKLRTAEPVFEKTFNMEPEQKWQVNEWVKKAVLLYFGIQQMETYTLPPFEFYDKMKLKKNYKEFGRSCGSACRCPLWCFLAKKCGADAELCEHWRLCR